MNYYDHYIGDYQAKTAHLSLAEHGAYLLMLQNFYMSERPLPADRKVLFRLLRVDSKQERAAVESVIRQYWTEESGALINRRASRAVEEYRRWVNKQRANGGKGGRPPKTQGQTQGQTQTKPNGNPNHNPSESETGDTTYHTTYHTTHTRDETTSQPPPKPGSGGPERVGVILGKVREKVQAWKPPTEEEIRAGK